MRSGASELFVHSTWHDRCATMSLPSHATAQLRFDTSTELLLMCVLAFIRFTCRSPRPRKFGCCGHPAMLCSVRLTPLLPERRRPPPSRCLLCNTAQAWLVHSRQSQGALASGSHGPAPGMCICMKLRCCATHLPLRLQARAAASRACGTDSMRHCP